MATTLSKTNFRLQHKDVLSLLLKAQNGKKLTYAARPGSSFEKFAIEYALGSVRLVGYLKTGGELLTRELTESDMATFLSAPIRLRGRVLYDIGVAYSM